MPVEVVLQFTSGVMLVGMLIMVSAIVPYFLMLSEVDRTKDKPTLITYMWLAFFGEGYLSEKGEHYKTILFKVLRWGLRIGFVGAILTIVLSSIHGEGI